MGNPESLVFSWYAHEPALYNYFISCHRKYSGQHNQCDIRAAHDGKVGCNTVKYSTAFLYSDWYIVKGFRAKRAYIAFWADFHYLQDHS